MEGNPKDKPAPKTRKWLGKEPALSLPASGEKAKIKDLTLQGVRDQLAFPEVTPLIHGCYSYPRGPQTPIYPVFFPRRSG